MLYSGFAKQICEGSNADWCELNCNNPGAPNCPDNCQCTESEEPPVVQTVVEAAGQAGVQDKGEANFGPFITALPLSPDWVLADHSWTRCTKNCGGGELEMDRKVISLPEGNGQLCSVLSNGLHIGGGAGPTYYRETRACNTHPCPGEQQQQF